MNFSFANKSGRRRGVLRSLQRAAGSEAKPAATEAWTLNSTGYSVTWDGVTAQFLYGRRQSNGIHRRTGRHARSQATPYAASARHSANAIERFCL